jgi:exoribonuclease R
MDSMKLKYPLINDRTSKEWHIFTIDPENSVDLDDGFSIQKVDDETTQISIYIANVSIWMDILDLWDTFSRRISTIYLPDKKRPMLPTILSDCLCSLQANTNRVAFCMDIFIKDNHVTDVQYNNCFINVSKNYHYEESALFKDKKYIQLLETTRKLTNTYKYISSIRNSHDLVDYLMTFMNCHCAKVLIDKKTGIFRTNTIKEAYPVPNNLDEEVSKFIKIWSSSSGQYVDGSTALEKHTIRHDLLNMEAYVHITSPIRRLVDLLNIIKFQQIMDITTLSEKAQIFYDNWLKDIDYINITMRSIRKIQCDCNLLDLCSNNPDVIDKEYDAYVFDKIARNDNLFQYIVYLPELKLSSRITTRENCNNFELKKIKLYLFHDEDRFKRKIRLHMMS